MKDSPQVTHTKKPCVCNVFKSGRLVWKQTGRTNPQAQSEFKCRYCGTIAWRAA
jgi:hypothetical protein